MLGLWQQGNRAEGELPEVRNGNGYGFCVADDRGCKMKKYLVKVEERLKNRQTKYYYGKNGVSIYEGEEPIDPKQHEKAITELGYDSVPKAMLNFYYWSVVNKMPNGFKNPTAEIVGIEV